MDLPGIHLLQAAVMLAEVRNYSRAAQRLGIHQPNLTKRILELEQIIGFPLFLRSTQFVEPTEACKQFVVEAKQSIFHAERSLYVARTAERGARTVLHVGKSRYADPYIISALNSVELPLYPNLELCQSSMYSQDLEAEILLGKLDLAIAVGDFDSRRVTQLELMHTPFYIVLHEGTPLASHSELNMHLLRDLSWALFDRHIHPALYDSILKAASDAHSQPRFIHHTASAEDAANELYSGGCEVAFLTRAGAWRIARHGLTMRPLAAPGLEISTKLIAKADNDSRLLSEFVRNLKRKLEVPSRTQLPLPLNGAL